MSILSEFLSDWRTVGAIVPTSRFAIRSMLDAVDWRQVRVAVELGSGTGNITRRILERLEPEARLLGVEINERFVTQVRNNLPDPRLDMALGSATDLDQMLAARGLGGADAIVSAIPFTSLDAPLRHAILQAAAAALSPGGRFVAIQYTPFVLPRLLLEHFGGYQQRRCWLNVPPALVYTCTRASSSGEAV